MPKDIPTLSTSQLLHVLVLIGPNIITRVSIFFAIFHHHSPTWDWNALPQAYRSSSRLSLDTQALEQYFKQDDIQFDTLQSESDNQEMGDAAPKRKVNKFIMGELHV